MPRASKKDTWQTCTDCGVQLAEVALDRADEKYRCHMCAKHKAVGEGRASYAADLKARGLDVPGDEAPSEARGGPVEPGRRVQVDLTGKPLPEPEVEYEPKQSLKHHFHWGQFTAGFSDEQVEEVLAGSPSAAWGFVAARVRAQNGALPSRGQYDKAVDNILASIQAEEWRDVAAEVA